ncbi:MAG: hypothetical protein WA705_10810 [Candidatus Ozemobacteraceae bacterium]
MKRIFTVPFLLLLPLAFFALVPFSAKGAVTAASNRYFADLQTKHASVQEANALVEVLREKIKHPPEDDSKTVRLAFWASATPVIFSAPEMTNDQLYPDVSCGPDDSEKKPSKKVSKRGSKKHSHKASARSKRRSGKSAKLSKSSKSSKSATSETSETSASLHKNKKAAKKAKGK